jgi:23S rRNA pseudouridine2457 synthase
MTAKVGFPTLRLVRVRIGHEKIEHLKPKEVYEVNEFNI